MSGWERIGDWIAALAVASFAWISSANAPDLPIDPNVAAVTAATAENQQTQMVGWAQQTEEPPIEQVGEDTGDDTELLDEAGRPEEAPESSEDLELLDQGEPPAAQDEDIELLDQGSPPASVVESPAPAVVTVAPTTTYVVPEPAVASGPALPEGFGTGNVHVSAGSTGFPVGLEDCHVGAVTGRAYVGIDCGDGSSFVGHAPTFENFPFVLDDSFPFGDDSVLVNRGPSLAEQEIEQNVEILVSASRGELDDDATAPVIRTSGNSSVEFAQRARNRKARVEADADNSKRRKDTSVDSRDEVRAATLADRDDRIRANEKDKKQKRDKDSGGRASSGDDEKKSNKSKRSKSSNNKGDKKAKKSKTR